MKISDLERLSDISAVLKQVTDVYLYDGGRGFGKGLNTAVEKQHLYSYVYDPYLDLLERYPIFRNVCVRVKCRESLTGKFNYIWCVYLKAPLSIFTKIWGYQIPEQVFESGDIFDDLSLINSEQTYAGYAEYSSDTCDPILLVGIDFDHNRQGHIGIQSPEGDRIPIQVAHDALQIYNGIVQDYLYAIGDATEY